MFVRLSRQQYLIRIGIAFLFFIIAPLIMEYSTAGVCLWLAIILFALHATICRSHDLNYSGWILFWLFVPVINLAYAILLLGLRGTVGPNKYGPDPLGNVTVEQATKQTSQVQAEQPKSFNLPSKKEQLRAVLKAKHPYQDMLIRNRV